MKKYVDLHCHPFLEYFSNPDEVIKRSNYKKLYEKYDICDYKDFAFWETYCLSCLRWSDSDYKRAYRKWLQFYRNK